MVSIHKAQRLDKAAARLLIDGAKHTERVPQDEGQLRNLLALLAELEEGGLAGALVEQVGNVGHGASVVFRDVLMAVVLIVGGILVAGRVGMIVGGETAIVLLLLLLLLSLLGLLLLGLLLLLLLLSLLDSRHAAALLRVVLLMAGLLDHPRRLGLVAELVVSVGMRRGHHAGQNWIQNRSENREVRARLRLLPQVESKRKRRAGRQVVRLGGGVGCALIAMASRKGGDRSQVAPGFLMRPVRRRVVWLARAGGQRGSCGRVGGRGRGMMKGFEADGCARKGK